jgi:histone-lysine N-methyltransferase SETMAR
MKLGVGCNWLDSHSLWGSKVKIIIRSRAIMDNAVQCQREIIFFLHKEGANGSDICRRLQAVFGDRALQKTMVYEWIHRFDSGVSTTADEPRKGRPTTSTGVDNVRKVESLLRQDSRVTVRELCQETNISLGSMHTILHEELWVSKLTARWVPRLLTPEQKENRMRTCSENLVKMSQDRNAFFQRLITCDETWLHAFEPETKLQSQQWVFAGEPVPLKAKVVPSVGKVLATVFWDEDGVIHIDYLDKGATINAAYYSALLKNEVRPALRRKRPGKLRSVPLLLQDNARPHTAKLTTEIIRDLQWEILPHPPYSPDLAPSDYHLFPSMKDPLRGIKMRDLEELKHHVSTWCHRTPTSFFADGIRKLEQRWQKCVELSGEYIEKLNTCHNSE